MNDSTPRQFPSPSKNTEKDEITQSRKDELRRWIASVRDIQPDIRRVKEGKYPFKGKRLTRGDIIFLLSEHEKSFEQVEESDLNQLTPKGLDLRGAILQGEDLGGLDLKHILTGLTEEEWFIATSDQCKMATTNLDDANFAGAKLQGATFCYAHLRRANFSYASLNDADLFGADLRGASFYKTNLSGANLHGANLEGAKVSKAAIELAGVDANILKEVVVERSIVPPWGTEKSKLPFAPDWFYHEYKSPRWLTGFGKTLMFPLLIALITLIATQAFDNISQKRQAEQTAQALTLQTNQKELDVKNSLLISMSSTVANALTELTLIQNDQESNDVNVAIKNYDDGYRNLLTNGAEIEAQLSAYFADGLICTNMTNYIPKEWAGYNNIVLAWDNYYRVILNNFYDLESNNDANMRSGDIFWINDVFDKYGIYNYKFTVDQKTVNWGILSMFSRIPKYKNTPFLMKVGDGSPEWNNLMQIIDGFKSVIGQCLINSHIPGLSSSSTPGV